jgi:hypothetical protein
VEKFRGDRCIVHLHLTLEGCPATASE